MRVLETSWTSCSAGTTASRLSRRATPGCEYVKPARSAARRWGATGAAAALPEVVVVVGVAVRRRQVPAEDSRRSRTASSARRLPGVRRRSRAGSDPRRAGSGAPCRVRRCAGPARGRAADRPGAAARSRQRRELGAQRVSRRLPLVHLRARQQVPGGDQAGDDEGCDEREPRVAADTLAPELRLAGRRLTARIGG